MFFPVSLESGFLATAAAASRLPEGERRRRCEDDGHGNGRSYMHRWVYLGGRKGGA